eukprot:TRINITY_DN29968_c0_g1_i1.p1 TRINITY_DN29968_c0_g1~~TRINITY_DN29968_c0_g1_i1.p1  ORF type:complete len:451 (+),score=224.42 TRINITY_DN29968_c0_g1_i1:30-1382(+)
MKRTFTAAFKMARPQLPVVPPVAVAPLPMDVFSDVRAKLTRQERNREVVFATWKAVGRKEAQALHHLGFGQIEKAKAALDDIKADLLAMEDFVKAPPPDRDGRISGLIQKYVALVAQLTYYDRGELITMAEVKTHLPGVQVEDSEYLIGAIDFVNELSSYGLRRGMHGDVASIAMSRDLAVRVNEHLMKFNFRNDGLRRSYDSVKWNVRRLTDLLYELSTVKPHDYAEVNSSGIDLDKAVNEAEFAAIQNRVETFDQTRELLMQVSRGKAQKTAKHAIFALHRGDLKKARAQIDEATEMAVQAHEEYVVGKYPSLRTGFFGDCLEELAEAVIFLVWLETGAVPPPSVIPLMTLDEYLGGLIDFTGEVGRYAVKCATKRDVAEVHKCFAVTLAVTEQVTMLPTDGRLGKKLDALRTNTRKIEQLMFELSKQQQNPLAAKGAAEEAPKTPRD